MIIPLRQYSFENYYYPTDSEMSIETDDRNNALILSSISVENQENIINQSSLDNKYRYESDVSIENKKKKMNMRVMIMVVSVYSESSDMTISLRFAEM